MMFCHASEYQISIPSIPPANADVVANRRVLRYRRKRKNRRSDTQPQKTNCQPQNRESQPNQKYFLYKFPNFFNHLQLIIHFPPTRFPPPRLLP